MATFRLNQAQREDLSDARLLLDNAVHNLQATLRNPDPDEAKDAFQSAMTLTQQAITAMNRVAEAKLS